MQPADAPDSTRPLVIANPAARRGRARRGLPEILKAMRGALGQFDVAATTHAGHAEELSREAARSGRPLIVSLGGDGTLNEIVNGLMTSAAAPPKLGLVAAGTGGDFGRSLGITDHLDDYLAALVSGRERTVDVGRARFVGNDGRAAERYWINVLSAGIGGLVDRYTAAAPAALGGRLAYAQATLRAIVMCHRRRLSCRWIAPDGAAHERLLDGHAVAICNGHTFGGGMRIAPAAALDDGLLDVLTFETRTRMQLIRRFSTLYAGTHLHEPGVSRFACRSLELAPAELGQAARSRGVFPLDVDGDARGDVPVAVDVLPSALIFRA